MSSDSWCDEVILSEDRPDSMNVQHRINVNDRGGKDVVKSRVTETRDRRRPTKQRIDTRIMPAAIICAHISISRDERDKSIDNAEKETKGYHFAHHIFSHTHTQHRPNHTRPHPVPLSETSPYHPPRPPPPPLPPPLPLQPRPSPQYPSTTAHTPRAQVPARHSRDS